MAVRNFRNIGTDPVLLGIVGGAIPNTEDFLGDRAMPVLRVSELSGSFQVRNARNLAGAPEKSGKRAIGADRVPAERHAPTDVPYALTEMYSGVDEMPKETYIMGRNLVSKGGEDPDVQMVQAAKRDAMIDIETANAALFFTAANWDNPITCATLNSLTGVSRAANIAWNASGATPDVDMIEVRNFVRRQTYGGVQWSQFGIRMDYETLVTLQLHLASSGIVEVNNTTSGVALANGQRVASADATLQWVRQITNIQDVEVFSVRKETANPLQTSSKANVATSGSFWCGILHGDNRVTGNGGTVATACGVVRFEDWMASSGWLPNESLATHRQAFAELVEKPYVFDSAKGLYVSACNG